ncbi:MAG TPA: 50S ribosomal protein L4 [Gemmataceae bacterium]|nr:50S ribosomal protein L4 [Gemmataceae bacterium]
MVTLNVYNRQGESVGTVDVDPAEFGGKVNKQLLHDVVVQYLANQRAGTHSTLRRGEVAGSTKKLFRQKGTGNARAGTRRTNKRKGGGTSKGPKPRDYEYHMPKRMVKAATRMAILSKLEDKEAIILDDLALTEVKTKQVVGLLKALTKALQPAPAPEAAPPAGEESLKKAKPKPFTWLVGTVGYDKNVYLSARNIHGVEVLPADQFNAYTVLKQKRLLLTKAALEALRKGKEPAEQK